MNIASTTLVVIVSIVLMASALACRSEGGTTASKEPLPLSVSVRQEPDGVTLANPAFEPLPGATTDYGRLGGSVYQIEVPDDWNGRLVLFMHGYGELEPEARVTAPGIRPYLILNGFAWGASSFSSTSWIPGRSVEETAALWDHFAAKYGRPEYTYVTGTSMGGAAAHLAAERTDGRFDGALALCGSAGTTEGLAQQSDFFVAAAYVAGVTQADYDVAADLGSLINQRIRPALQDKSNHVLFENIMIDLTGGPRDFDREGFLSEEETNWERMMPLVAAHIAPDNPARYPLGVASGVPDDAFDAKAINLDVNAGLLDRFLEGYQTTGDLQMPMMTMHTTGDGQVPIYQAQLLRHRVDVSGKSDLLVQRVFRDAGHCGFNYAEWESGFEALVAWVEDGERPTNQDVLVDDLRTLSGDFELAPRAGLPEANTVPGAVDRVLLHGTLTLDGSPFDATFLGAVVRNKGLATPCQLTLPAVEDGRFEIAVRAQAETRGCGVDGSEVFLWTFSGGRRLVSVAPLIWPGDGEEARFDAAFLTSLPEGSLPETLDFAGDAFQANGERYPPGTRVEARIGGALCGVTSMARTGSFSGFVLSVAGSHAIEGCDIGATISFEVDGVTALQTAINDPALQERGLLTLITE